MSDMTVANTILEQLGNGRFIVMTGARNFLGDVDSLSFRLPSTGHFVKQGINYIKIRLTVLDTYEVTFGKVRGLKFAVLSTIDNVYADGLRDLISEETGLTLSIR
jgi:hypothetical protein